ncbi:hypothetical protein ABEP17_18375 [Priestia flexa]|uniref:hypothetical protein n=1 Tax=Priestia flexa TaxID=86664 RepID=UPI003D2B288E
MNEESKLLVIELDSINDVPKVYYKGEEITNKMRVDFTWITKNECEKVFGSPYINIEHVVTGEGCHLKRIGYNERVIAQPSFLLSFDEHKDKGTVLDKWINKLFNRKNGNG